MILYCMVWYDMALYCIVCYGMVLYVIILCILQLCMVWYSVMCIPVLTTLLVFYCHTRKFISIFTSKNADLQTFGPLPVFMLVFTKQHLPASRSNDYEYVPEN
jgi:hypothetical protein